VVDVLVIPDGAAQPVRVGTRTALELACTPVLDSLAAEGRVLRVATTPSGLPAGSETGIPSLLGVPQPRASGRGWVDAAAYDLEVPAHLTPWRADLVYRNGRRGSIHQARNACKHLGRHAHAVSGHRLLLLAASQPGDRKVLGLHVRVWPGGPAPEGQVPVATTVICAPGAAAGCARLLGAEVVHPSGATGDVDTDLRAKANAAIRALSSGTGRIVVHVGAPDEAAHRRDADAVIEALERLDTELLDPLREAVHAAGGRLAVCPDHGTDPATGGHDPAPVPAVVWGAGVGRDRPRRLTERAAAAVAVIPAAELLSVATVAG
jgi:2,3-bisphosphoglycerate-independent phosphoglycerate mutase